MTPRKNPLISFVIDSQLLGRVDDFRYDKRFPTRAAAIKWLLQWALDQNPEPLRSQKGGVRS